MIKPLCIRSCGDDIRDVAAGLSEILERNDLQTKPTHISPPQETPGERAELIRINGIREAQKMLPPLGLYSHYLKISENNPFYRLMVMGRSKTGKTTLAVSIVFNHVISYVHRAIFICPSIHTQTIFRAVTYKSTPEDIISEIPDDQFFGMLHDQIREQYAQSNGEQRTLLFIDDLGSEHSVHLNRKGRFGSMATEAGHIGLTIIGLFQQGTMVSPSFRDNLDNIILFPPGRKADYDLYAREFDPYIFHPEYSEEMMEKLREIWIKNGFVFIHRPARQQAIVCDGFEKIINLNS